MNPKSPTFAPTRNRSLCTSARYGDLLNGLEAVIRPRHGTTFSAKDKSDMLRELKTFIVENPPSAAPVPFKSYDPRTHSGYGPPVALNRGFYFPHTHPDYKKFYGGSSSRENTSNSPPSSPLADQHRNSYCSPARSPPPRRDQLPKNAPIPRKIQYTDVYGRPISPDIVAKFHGDAPKPSIVNSETGKVKPAQTRPRSTSPTSFVISNTGAGETKAAEEKHGKTDIQNVKDMEQKVAVKDAKPRREEKVKVKKNDQGKYYIAMKKAAALSNEDKVKPQTTDEPVTSQDSHTPGFPKAAANIKQKRAAPPTTPTPTSTARAQTFTVPWPPASSTNLGPGIFKNFGVGTFQRGSLFASASTGPPSYNPFGEDEADEDIDTDEDTEGEEEGCTPHTIQSTQSTQESPQAGSLLGKRRRDFDEDENASQDEVDGDDVEAEAETTKGAHRSISPGGDRKQSKRFKRD